MHLSWKELKIAYAIYGGPETERQKWYREYLYDETPGSSGCAPWEETPEEQVSGRYSYRTADVPATAGEIYPPVRQHPDGCECNLEARLYANASERFPSTRVVEEGSG